MSMTREDILRELELLPVWKLRHPTSANEALAENTPVVTGKAVPLDVLVISPEPVVSEFEINESSIHSPVEQNPKAEKPKVEKIVKQWAFVCSVSRLQAQACSILLNNIVKATHLASTDYVLLNDIQAIDNYQLGDILLFGLEVANAYLNINEVDLANLRGQYYMVDDVRCWVTYHPEQMLQDPLLKRDVWRDICAAMPQLGKSL
jgi:uracil-DNA glycosylase